MRLFKTHTGELIRLSMVESVCPLAHNLDYRNSCEVPAGTTHVVAAGYTDVFLTKDDFVRLMTALETMPD